ncbi:Spo11/DNA topoisomerase VI subunit A [Coprinopsis sp. MPI-PUGE-AT-0042]|nr:Spo11/DNA topoisomerase VI subunit A [Coprinopsis sp. MPI-PUGE-AT-0042]
MSQKLEHDVNQLLIHAATQLTDCHVLQSNAFEVLPGAKIATLPDKEECYEYTKGVRWATRSVLVLTYMLAHIVDDEDVAYRTLFYADIDVWRSEAKDNRLGYTSVYDVVTSLAKTLRVPFVYQLHICSNTSGLILGNGLTIKTTKGETIKSGLKRGATHVPNVRTIESVSLSEAVERIIVVDKHCAMNQLKAEGIFKEGASLENTILIACEGMMDIPTKILLLKISELNKIPMFVLCDCDPAGLLQAFNLKYGGIKSDDSDYGWNGIPSLRWIGVFPSEMTSPEWDLHPTTSGRVRLCQPASPETNGYSDLWTENKISEKYDENPAAYPEFRKELQAARKPEIQTRATLEIVADAAPYRHKRHALLRYVEDKIHNWI